jgi:hypothetical protein
MEMISRVFSKTGSNLLIVEDLAFYCSNLYQNYFFSFMKPVKNYSMSDLMESNAV